MTPGAAASELSTLLDDLEPLQHAVGLFGKETALETVSKALGSDRAFSGLRRRARLGAGYDLGTPVILNLRPAGLWFLADDGRKRRGKITPRRRGGKRAVMTPRGPRASSSYGRSRGLRVLLDTEDAIDRGIERAAYDGLDQLLRSRGF